MIASSQCFAAADEKAAAGEAEDCKKQKSGIEHGSPAAHHG
jgi:hypothetical protein